MSWILVLLVLLVGCTSKILVKDGATAQQFEADKFECEQKVVTMYGGYANMGPGHAIMARGDILQCMNVKGWREQTAESNPSPEDVWRKKAGVPKS